MTREAALLQFFGQFMDAYPVTAVPDDVAYPYLTYEQKLGDCLSGDINISVRLWFYTESEKIPNDKIREIESVIGIGGVMVNYDGGAIWIKRASPWCQPLTDETSPTIKGRYLNINLEFI